MLHEKTERSELAGQQVQTSAMFCTGMWHSELARQHEGGMLNSKVAQWAAGQRVQTAGGKRRAGGGHHPRPDCLHSAAPCPSCLHSDAPRGIVSWALWHQG